MNQLAGNQGVVYLREQRDAQFDVCRRLADQIRRNCNVTEWARAKTAGDFAAATSSKSTVIAISEELAREQDVLYALDSAIDAAVAGR